MFQGAGVALQGWKCSADTQVTATIIYLHGVGDTRGSGLGVVERYVRKGYDVIAYDSRAHGNSEGSICTYGYFEKQDLIGVMGTIERGPIVLIGTSLGAAVALQAAAEDARITAIIAAETFSDLRTVAVERAPWILSDRLIERSFRFAEERGRFDVNAVSPVKAAARIKVPVLLIHGADDRETLPSHSDRILSALNGRKRLIRVKGAGHNQSLQSEITWNQIDAWIDESLTLKSDGKLATSSQE
jgi:pimeloyl-ACP methyl ester carboxylesterase